MQNYMQLMGLDMSPLGIMLFVFIILWSIFWKGLALWHAVKRNEKKWFIVILILNTFSVLELAYLFFVVKIKSIRLD